MDATSESPVVWLTPEQAAEALGLRHARFGGVIHDFVVLNALHDTEAARHAVMPAVASLSARLRSVT